MTVDPDRLAAMVTPIMGAVRANYTEPKSRDRVYEALNALAMVTATVIVGCGDRDARRQAAAWFDKALTANIIDMKRNPPN